MNHNQRWREGKDSYRKRGEGFDAEHYGVELLVNDTTPRNFVVKHHYSASYPAARCRVGLYRTTRSLVPDLVGVAVFSVPARGCLEKRAGVDKDEGCELGRFVLLDDVPFPGETWFLRRAFKVLEEEKPELRAVVSFSDPLQRKTERGHVVMPGHVGTIYQAFNGRFVGRTKVEHLWLDADGRLVAPRSLAKIRNNESGGVAAYERLRAAGARGIAPGESPREYVNRALQEGPFRRVRHPGNLAYVWAIGQRRKTTRRNFPGALDYIKAEEGRVHVR